MPINAEAKKTIELDANKDKLYGDDYYQLEWKGPGKVAFKYVYGPFPEFASDEYEVNKMTPTDEGILFSLEDAVLLHDIETSTFIGGQQFRLGYSEDI